MTCPKRPPLIVWLPGGAAAWCLDNRAPNGGHWDFSPVEPLPGESMESWVQKLTVTPSINAVGCYHGFIRNGALTSDVDGRKL